jgi:hypothetical protein
LQRHSNAVWDNLVVIVQKRYVATGGCSRPFIPSSRDPTLLRETDAADRGLVHNRSGPRSIVDHHNLSKQIRIRERAQDGPIQQILSVPRRNNQGDGADADIRGDPAASIEGIWWDIHRADHRTSFLAWKASA